MSALRKSIGEGSGKAKSARTTTRRRPGAATQRDEEARVMRPG